MTPEAQRIAIAEFCGWTKCRLTVKGAGAPERRPSPHGVPPQLPDFCNDLNAMHEAEKRLTEEQYEQFGHALINKVLSHASSTAAARMVLSAPAAQRAEALLRTIGKWQTEKEPTK
jgi:hypothetical protein